MFWFTTISPLDVLPGYLDLALKTRDAVCIDLGIAKIAIRWIRPCSEFDAKCVNHDHRVHEWATSAPGTKFGATATPAPAFSSPIDIAGDVDALRDDRINVRVDLDEDELVRTVAHEIRHCWQGKHWGYSLAPADVTADDGDAEAYAVKFATTSYARKVTNVLYEQKITG